MISRGVSALTGLDQYSSDGGFDFGRLAEIKFYSIRLKLPEPHQDTLSSLVPRPLPAICRCSCFVLFCFAEESLPVRLHIVHIQ